MSSCDMCRNISPQLPTRQICIQVVRKSLSYTTLHAPQMLAMKIHHCNACYMFFFRQKNYSNCSLKKIHQILMQCVQCSRSVVQATCSILIFNYHHHHHHQHDVLNKHVYFENIFKKCTYSHLFRIDWEQLHFTTILSTLLCQNSKLEFT